MRVHIEDSLQESVVIFCHVGPGDATQVIRLSGKHLYLLWHLTNRVKDLKRSLSFIIWLNINSITCHLTWERRGSLRTATWGEATQERKRWYEKMRAGKGEEWLFPRASRGSTALPMSGVQTSRLQKICFWCFRLPVYGCDCSPKETSSPLCGTAPEYGANITSYK